MGRPAPAPGALCLAEEGAASGAAVEVPAPPSPARKMTLGFAFILEVGIL